MAKQQMRQTHAGIAAFMPWIAQKGQAGHTGPTREASTGAMSWLHGPIKQHSGHNPQLDMANGYAAGLIRASGWLHRAASNRGLYRQLDSRVGWGDREWAGYYHQRTHEKYVEVPLWAVLGAPGTVNRTSSIGNYTPFRRAQPAVKAQSLAQALAAAANAIQSASNG